MSPRLISLITAILLSMVFLLAFFSIREDSFTFDETAHITAGYSYLTQKDYRLNPEHPPLIKDLAALPLLFSDLNFPKDHPAWLQKEPPQWWFQFDLASQFLYKSGNNPDQILLWSRTPLIMLLVFLGWFIFYWTKKLFGTKPALLTLFFFSFSPTFLAHGRLITTDVGAALGVVIATCFWLNFLKNPSKKNLLLAGLILGIALLLKFSLILLLPFFLLTALLYALIHKLSLLKYSAFFIVAGIIALLFVILPVYQFHVSNYPAEQQTRDTKFLLENSFLPEPAQKSVVWLSSQNLTKPLAHYLLGVSLVINRAGGGNTTYFLGEISAEGWKNYFPIVYLIKEPLSFHILTLIALLSAILLLKKFLFGQNVFQRTKEWLKSHFPELAMLLFIGIYWFTSLNSKLNIGVRHLLPVLPFTFILVSLGIANLLKSSWLKLKYGLLTGLIAWQVISVFSIYPHFLAYFNELVGGPDKGYLFAVDSNLDWGQDLKRLKKWLGQNNIDKIYLDYFGGGDAQYELKEKFLPWQGKKSPTEFPKNNYLAVSVTLLQGGRARQVKGFDQPSDYYRWLDKYEPVAKIGHSIFVYYID